MVYVFDLDDTLYKEVDFLQSAFAEIACEIGEYGAYEYLMACYHKGKNVFACAIERYHLDKSIDQLLLTYRNHYPSIELDTDTAALLNRLRAKGDVLALLTDGRSLTQRNKISALRLERWFTDADIIISEEFGYGKPAIECYEYFIKRYPDANFAAIGDNLAKDFVTPNKLGWQTICLLDNGQNIHKQDFTLERLYLPKFRVASLNSFPYESLH